MNLSNLTIVIITYNRYSLLKRLVNFYQSFKTDVKILILDSSSENLLDESLRAMLKSENVVWKRFDPSIFFVEKIAQGSIFINTEYAVLCADDDFLFPSSLDQAVRFLSNNNDYSSCLGLQYKHHVVSFLTKKFFIFRESAIGGCEAIEERASNRILKYLSGCSVYYPMYAVHTSENLKKIWQDSSKFTSDWGLSEIFPCCYSLALGKMKVMQIPYTTRERNPFSWQDDQRVKEMYSFEKVEKVKNRLGEIVSKAEGISNSQGVLFANKAIDIFLQRIFNKVKNIERLATNKQKVKLLLTNLPYIGVPIVKLYSNLMGLLRLYFINRATPLKHLDNKTGRYLKDALDNSKSDMKEVIKSRKDYA
jgi:glycosyltransferase domain-containing protein